MKDPQTSQVAPDPWRVAQVQAAVRVWTGQLMDLGGRNTLLFYRDLGVGTLDVADADSVALAALLDGRTVGLSQLFRDPDGFAQARRRARAIRNKARELVEERGIETCFLAVGMASWENLRGMATPAAPVLLWQAVIRARGAAEEDFDLALTGELEVNPTLLHLLAQDFGLQLDADKLLDVYTHQDLVRLIRWIESDTLLRTEEELLNEVMNELGFQRRGSRIREAVAAAVASARRR